VADWWIHLAGVGGLTMLAPTVMLLASLRWGWTAFEQDFPTDVQALLPEPTRGEVWGGRVLGSAFLLTLVASVLVTTATWPRSSESFLSAWLMAFGAVVLFCVIDLLFVDWLVICAWRPRWVVIRGTEAAEGWGDYAFHLKAQFSAKGIAVLVAAPLPFAAVARFLW